MDLFRGQTGIGLFIDQHGRAFMAPSQAIGFKQRELLVGGCFTNLDLQHVFKGLDDRLLPCMSQVMVLQTRITYFPRGRVKEE